MNKKRFYLICILLAAVISSGITGLKLTGRDVPLSGLLRSLTRPICNAAISLRDSVAQKQAAKASAQALAQRVAELEKQNSALLSQIALERGDNNVDTSVRAVLPAGTASNYLLLQAYVIGTDGRACPGCVTVNVGTRDGVKLYTPVMTAAGLIGYVSDVGNGWAKITTLADASFSCGVSDNDTGWVGVAHGTGSSAASATDTVELRYTNADSVFHVGDVLVTSGIGSVFPQGLPVGIISEINTRTYDRLMTAKVTPMADTTAAGLTHSAVWLLLSAPQDAAPDTEAQEQAQDSSTGGDRQ